MASFILVRNLPTWGKLMHVNAFIVMGKIVYPRGNQVNANIKFPAWVKLIQILKIRNRSPFYKICKQ